MRSFNHLLVTGGAGFIGSAFIRHVLSQPDFHGGITNLDALTYAANPWNVGEFIVDPRYRLVRGDIGDMEHVSKLCDHYAVDGIVHFAAESHVDRSIMGPMLFVETNVIGTAKLLEVARARPSIHFHHVSTDEVFGSLGDDGLFSEQSPYQPNSPYAASKASSDHIVRAYGHTYGISTTISNCSNNYGPCQFPEKLIPLMILNMLERKPLPVYGDGLNVRDWLHVEDHAEAIWTILKRGESGETYNVGGNCERTNLDLLHAIIRIFASETGCDASDLQSLVTFVPDRAGHDRRYAIDATKIRQELGFEPSRSLEDGLRSTVRWYLDHPKWIEQVRLRR
jgi:dTDP-glucose 4,6-dehydratase